jgi:hypothetical protein
MTVVVDVEIVVVDVDVWVQVYKKKRRSERESDRRRFSRSSNNTSTFRSGFTGRGKKTSQTGSRQRSHTYGRPSGQSPRLAHPGCRSWLIRANARGTSEDVKRTPPSIWVSGAPSGPDMRRIASRRPMNRSRPRRRSGFPGPGDANYSLEPMSRPCAGSDGEKLAGLNMDGKGKFGQRVEGDTSDLAAVPSTSPRCCGGAQAAFRRGAAGSVGVLQAARCSRNLVACSWYRLFPAGLLSSLWPGEDCRCPVTQPNGDMPIG